MGYGLDEAWEYEPTEEEELELLFYQYKKQYLKNDIVKVGDKINCAWCGKAIKKKSYQHKFCTTKCKDSFWNIAPRRIARTLEWKND